MRMGIPKQNQWAGRVKVGSRSKGVVENKGVQHDACIMVKIIGWKQKM